MGVPPTARKARTGLFTPPGMTRAARSKSVRETGSLMRCSTYDEARRSGRGDLRQRSPRGVGAWGLDRIRADSVYPAAARAATSAIAVTTAASLRRGARGTGGRVAVVGVSILAGGGGWNDGAAIGGAKATGAGEGDAIATGGGAFEGNGVVARASTPDRGVTRTT